jgi:large subunit ribosomal protein L17
MNNKTGFNRLNRRAGHRRALIKNMVTSLFTYERITTTKSKALEVRRHAEKMVTRAKVDSVHNRREIAKTITQGDVLAKLFNVLGPRFQSRAGGYTRILKVGQRSGDAAEMVIFEFVERTEESADAPAPAAEAKAFAKRAPAEKAAVKKAFAKKVAAKKAAAE